MGVEGESEGRDMSGEREERAREMFVTRRLRLKLRR